MEKEIEETYRNAYSIRYTQLKNGIGLLQDNELRYFHDEYNDRTWKHGFGSLPSSFNVLEGFFKWNPKLFYFELIDEVEKSDTRTTPGRFQLTILMPWCY
jgi:hypothetical protein